MPRALVSGNAHMPTYVTTNMRMLQFQLYVTFYEGILILRTYIALQRGHYLDIAWKGRFQSAFDQTFDLTY